MHIIISKAYIMASIEREYLCFILVKHKGKKTSTKPPDINNKECVKQAKKKYTQPAKSINELSPTPNI